MGRFIVKHWVLNAWKLLNQLNPSHLEDIQSRQLLVLPPLILRIAAAALLRGNWLNWKELPRLNV